MSLLPCRLFWSATAVVWLLFISSCGVQSEDFEYPQDTVSLSSAINLSCTKDPAVLALLATAPRTCAFDEHCPDGSYCDPLRNLCRLNCGPAGSGAPLCSGTAVCDCFGKCVQPTGTTVSTTAPQLSVTPTLLQLKRPAAGTAWSARFFDVTLSVPVGMPTAKFNAAQVRIRAEADTEVSCPLPLPATWKTECTLSNWVFAQVGAEMRATQRVRTRPKLDVTGSAWTVSLNSTVTAPRDLRVNLRVQPAVAPAHKVSTTGAYRWKGTVRLDIPVGAHFRTMVVPVEAYSGPTPGTTVFLDPLRLLSIDGHFTVYELPTGTQYATEAHFWLGPWEGESLERPSGDGMAGVYLTPAPGGEVTTQTNAERKGSFQIQLFKPVYNSLRATFELNRSRELDPARCTTITNTCGASMVCHPRIEACVPKIEFLAQPPANTYLAFYNFSVFHDFHNYPPWGLVNGSYPSTSNADNLKYAEQVLCAEGGRKNLDRRLIRVGTPLPTSGDLGCGPNGSNIADALPMSAVPLFGRADRYQVKTKFGLPVTESELPLSANALLAECLADLSKPIPEIRGFSTIEEQLTYRYDTPEKCISLLRFFDAQKYLDNVLWRELNSPGSVLASELTRAQRLRHRLTQQWVQLFAFIGRQGLEAYRAKSILSQPAPSVPTLELLIASLEKGWDAVHDDSYDPAFRLLMEKGSCVLWNPDYRSTGVPWMPDGSLSSVPHHEQGIPYTLSVMEGLTNYHEVVNAYLEEAARKTLELPRSDPQVVRALKRGSRAFRYTVPLEMVMAALHEKQSAACKDPATGLTASAPWQKRWNSSMEAFERARAGTLERVRVLADGDSFGFSEEEVPLFFRSSASTADSQYFASSEYLQVWANDSLAQAKSAMDKAQLAWTSQLQNAVQTQMVPQDSSRRVEQLRAQYTSPVTELCGLTAAEASNALERSEPGATDPIFPETCFVAKAKPECNVVATAVYEAVRDPAARTTLCVWNQLGSLLTPSADVKAILPLYAGATVDALKVNSGTQSIPVSALYVPPPGMERAPQEKVAAAYEFCEQRLGAITYLPSPQTIGRAFPTSCYRGDIGAAMVSLMSANKSLQAAQSAWGDAEERYQVAGEQCLALQARIATVRTDLVENHRQSVVTLRAIRLKHERKANGFDAAAGGIQNVTGGIGAGMGAGAAIGAAAGSAVPVIGTIIGGAVGAIVGAIGAIFGGNASADRDQAMVHQALMEGEATNYEAAMQQFELNERVIACFAEARQQVIGIKTAAINAERAAMDFELAVLDLANRQERVRQLLAEGLAAVNREKGRTTPTIAHHYWLDDNLTLGFMHFDKARRVAFMLAKAMEYELQVSLPETTRVLQAENPKELEVELSALDNRTRTRNVDGKLPSADSVFVSMATDVLPVEGLSSEVLREWTPAERFSYRLNSPSSAVYDSKGAYLGQGLRFALPPELYGLASRCGERLWGVKAFVDFEGQSWDPKRGIALKLMKRNTFQSNWCNGHGDGTPWQARYIEPSSLAAGVQLSSIGQSQEAQFYSSASIRGWLAGDFAAPHTSFELAARGLYGDYLLIVSPPPAGALTFTYSDIKNITLQFDVVSVDNSGQPSLSRASR